jgi:multidrug efflux pump subunit AcrA (membrane-fusion protein)
MLTKTDSGNRPVVGAVLVPVGAVHDRGSGPGVWIVNEKSEVTFRLVHISSIGKEDIVVSRGLEAGEKVVALGAHLLHEGQAVSPADEVEGKAVHNARH